MLKSEDLIMETESELKLHGVLKLNNMRIPTLVNFLEVSQTCFFGKVLYILELNLKINCNHIEFRNKSNIAIPTLLFLFNNFDNHTSTTSYD